MRKGGRERGRDGRTDGQTDRQTDTDIDWLPLVHAPTGGEGGGMSLQPRYVTGMKPTVPGASALTIEQPKRGLASTFIACTLTSASLFTPKFDILFYVQRLHQLLLKVG